jgi:Leucine-rich repeat (LRR) protein
MTLSESILPWREHVVKRIFSVAAGRALLRSCHTAVAAAEQLETLDMARPGIRSFEPLAGLGKLRKVDAHMTEATDLTLLAKCAALQELDVSSTACHSLEPLAALQKLRRLDVSWTRASTIGELVGLPSLREINLCGTRVRDLRPLALFPALTTVCLDPRQRGLPGMGRLRALFPQVNVIGPSQW